MKELFKIVMTYEGATENAYKGLYFENNEIAEIYANENYLKKYIVKKLTIPVVSKSFYCSKDPSHKRGLCDKQCNDCKEWMKGLMNQPPQ